MEMAVVLIGALGGAGYGLLGYAKAKSKPDPAKNVSFDVIHFAKSVLTGAIVGGAVTYGGGTVSFESIETFVTTSAIYPMIVAVINKATGIIANIFRRI